MSHDEFEITPGRNPLVLVGGAILVGLALALVFWGGRLFGGEETAADTAVSPNNSGLLQVGDAPHDFVLNDLDGNPVQLSELRGRPIILNFWATWCVPCRIEMPELQAAFVEHQDKGLVILAVDNQESAKAVDLFFSELGLTFTPVLDPEGTVAAQYNIVNLPTTLFINPEGVITVVHRGIMVKEQLDIYLAQTIPDL